MKNTNLLINFLPYFVNVEEATNNELTNSIAFFKTELNRLEEQKEQENVNKTDLIDILYKMKRELKTYELEKMAREMGIKRAAWTVLFFTYYFCTCSNTNYN